MAQATPLLQDEQESMKATPKEEEVAGRCLRRWKGGFSAGFLQGVATSGPWPAVRYELHSDRCPVVGTQMGVLWQAENASGFSLFHVEVSGSDSNHGEAHLPISVELNSQLPMC